MIPLTVAFLMLVSWDPGMPPPGAPPLPPPGMRGMHPPHHPDGWLDSALTGRTRKPWAGVVELELPDGRRDTAIACGGPDGFRLDFRDGRAHWVHGDTIAFLHAASRTARVITPPKGAPPRPATNTSGPKPLAMGLDTCLGRGAVVYLQKGPRGGARRLWIDTTLPLLLRGEGPGPGGRRLLSLDLSRGCAADAFTLPANWTVDRHEPKRPNDEPNIPSLARSVGFRIPMPSWIPVGFESAGQSWIGDGRRRIAHVRWSDGARHISLFVTKGSKGFQDCDNGPCSDNGPDPALVRHFEDVSVLIAAPLPPDDLRRMAESLR